ncbi:sigma-70 family RNA polymerase sigma factor [Acidithiobacillus sp.]|uniref:sigma-70 family RNA polymerase sigma factor n=1 Tax=Acidithiobacillus sp. TaxID=1872118 RepID=UPI0025C23331|nr:sigma-70 family RNA polymerase sigma factor [Acidithiobacillus sp.]
MPARAKARSHRLPKALPQAQEPDIPQDLLPLQENGPFLSPEQESAVIAQIRKGDEGARATIVSAHMPLVRAIARSYRNKGLSQEDLVQEGYMGLMRAVDRFQEGMGTRFSSYATWWIREAMQRALIRARFIRLPDYLAKSLHALQQKSLDEVDGHEAQRAQRREALGVRDSTMRALDFADVRVCSLDEEMEDGPSRIEQVVGDVASPAQDYDRDASVRALREHLKLLNEKQREVMIYRFGLHGDAPMTLEAIAERLGVSREAVRQLQVRALLRLRQALSESGWAG